MDASLREFVELPSSWPPACVEGGVRVTVHYIVSVDPLDPLEPVDPVPCRNLVFCVRETLTFENRI